MTLATLTATLQHPDYQPSPDKKVWLHSRNGLYELRHYTINPDEGTITVNKYFDLKISTIRALSITRPRRDYGRLPTNHKPTIH